MINVGLHLVISVMLMMRCVQSGNSEDILIFNPGKLRTATIF